MVAIDIVNKLVALALHNPNEEEARSAALQALRLMEKHQIPIGNFIPDREAKWEPPPADFMATVEEILKGHTKQNQTGNSYGGDSTLDNREAFETPQTPGAVATMKGEPEIESQEDAIRWQVVRAWRAIRETRKQLDAEIQRYERETHRKFTGNGRWM